MTDKFNLEEYEKIVEDHGHLTVYYPQAIIQETFRKKLTVELWKSYAVSGLTKNSIEEIVNKTIRGY